ncbi:MAG: hypothetical protein H6734_27355 [Alphaproteobacteria bacterium]|nr:hypothetical protein [Alphaproteobacteria bacterium]
MAIRSKSRDGRWMSPTGIVLLVAVVSLACAGLGSGLPEQEMCGLARQETGFPDGNALNRGLGYALDFQECRNFRGSSVEVAYNLLGEKGSLPGFRACRVNGSRKVECSPFELDGGGSTASNAPAWDRARPYPRTPVPPPPSTADLVLTSSGLTAGRATIDLRAPAASVANALRASAGTPREEHNDVLGSLWLFDAVGLRLRQEKGGSAIDIICKPSMEATPRSGFIGELYVQGSTVECDSTWEALHTEQDALIRAGQLGAMGEKGVSAGPANVRFYTTSDGGLSTITVSPRD